MKKTFRKFLIAILGAALSASALTACGKNVASDDKKISIGVSPVPHAEIVKEVVKPILEKNGYELKIVEFNDYVQPNTSLEEGEIDANYFQTARYLENENKERELHLVSVAEIHLEPMGLYSKKYKSLTEIPDGADIAIPNDGSNESRALALLADNGLITLSETDNLYNLTNIKDNLHNYSFSEIEAASLPVTLEDVDAAVINGNYALAAGYNPSEDSLLLESVSSESIKQYFNDLVVKSGNENSNKIKVLKEAMTSDEVKKYIEDKYKGSVIPAF